MKDTASLQVTVVDLVEGVETAAHVTKVSPHNYTASFTPNRLGVHKVNPA